MDIRTPVQSMQHWPFFSSLNHNAGLLIMKALWPFDAAMLFAAMIAASAAPTASAIENTTHPTPAPLCDEWRFAATDGDLLNQTSQSLRFDVFIVEDVQINSIKVFLAPGCSNISHKIFFHPGIWQVDSGNWTQIASGNNGEVDSDGFTASLPFDSPLSFSVDTGLISFRIDMANRLRNFRADFPTLPRSTL